MFNLANLIGWTYASSKTSRSRCKPLSAPPPSTLVLRPLTKSNPNSVFLPASDIPRFVAESNVDVGITGQDVILESRMEHLITEELSLGFGKCKMQVQVPENGPVNSAEDLAGKRIATSFEVLARGYFEDVDKRVGLAGEAGTSIEYLSGSVEAACSLGLADGIGRGSLFQLAYCY